MIAARYGGEEFALLLASQDIDAALAVGETVRAAVAALRLPHAAVPSGIVTVSVGVASMSAATGDSSAEFDRRKPRMPRSIAPSIAARNAVARPRPHRGARGS